MLRGPIPGRQARAWGLALQRPVCGCSVVLSTVARRAGGSPDFDRGGCPCCLSFYYYSVVQGSQPLRP